MGDTPSRGNDRLGPYHLSNRSWYLGRQLGHLHAAHNLQTGAFGVVMTSDKASAWPLRTAWTARVTSTVSPSSLSLEVEPAPDARPPSLLELTLAFDHLVGTLGNLRSQQDRDDVQAHLDRKPRGSWRGRLLSRGPPLLAGVAMGAGLALLVLWLRSPEPQQALEVAEATLDEPVGFIDMEEPPFPFIGYPMPETPFKEQQKPPCLKGTAVEIRGGCWVTLEQRAPCPKSTAEFEGKCYMPVRKKDPLPSTLQP
ncbi:protein kinase [Archangium sp.]|uniref:protein kinase n=1 Tax=Archangium sp. TaxID=1872627 RepID=UPI00286D29FE|nr:protein kinase [Archangium sp.]